ncbi:site-specific integrase [Paraferrimonas sp. SM1919]|uniref:tyrosine-type recombinase/integrase n=1 Tax=Paraferrimonas sp. SM1919 TaxID=2662263 RepID=UPI0013D2E6AF|nr:site-specific integrase [Paraferrimonas sp. SM1919]
MQFFIPLFDSPQYLLQGNPQVNQSITELTVTSISDAGLSYELACEWLYEQRHSENNYKAYRSELTTFLLWCFYVEKISPAEVTRKSMGRYIDFCQRPPEALINYYNVAQFKQDKASGERFINNKWKPFRGKKDNNQALPYQLSDNALKTKIAILSAFYGYLLAEEYCERNPAQMWLCHSRFAHSSKYQLSNEDINQLAFTPLQWSYILESTTELARSNPQKHQRSLFLLKLMYACYLRVSEVAARPGYSPMMSQFQLDQTTGSWRFNIPASKGGKARAVTVSDQLLEALKEYRIALAMAPLPGPFEQSPLFVRHRAAGRGRDVGVLNANLGIRQLREDIHYLLEQGALLAQADGFNDDAEHIRSLTCHNIRHTGITHDINIYGRPLSHVQADAGHQSIDTTSGYLHTSFEERQQSAKRKQFDVL